MAQQDEIVLIEADSFSESDSNERSSMRFYEELADSYRDRDEPDSFLSNFPDRYQVPKSDEAFSVYVDPQKPPFNYEQMKKFS